MPTIRIPRSSSFSSSHDTNHTNGANQTEKSVLFGQGAKETGAKKNWRKKTTAWQDEILRAKEFNIKKSVLSDQGNSFNKTTSTTRTNSVPPAHHRSVFGLDDGGGITYTTEPSTLPSHVKGNLIPKLPNEPQKTQTPGAALRLPGIHQAGKGDSNSKPNDAQKAQTEFAGATTNSLPHVNGKPQSQPNEPTNVVRLTKDENGAYFPENVNKSSNNLSGSSTPSDVSLADNCSNSSDSTNGLSSSTTPTSGFIVPTPPKRKPN